MAKIGFIGLGALGSALAQHLIKAGHIVKAYDLDAALIDRLVDKGAQACRSAASAADDVETLISVLPGGDIIEGLYIDEEALLDFVDPATQIIDCSTVSLAATRRVHDEAARRGVAMVDAPPIGGIEAAQDGSLCFVCGGTETHFNQARPVLELMSRRVIHAGAAGAGQIAKAATSLLQAINMVGVSEALQLGMDQGLDPLVLSQIMQAGTGETSALALNNPVPGISEQAPATRGYEGGMSVETLSKDLSLAMQLAADKQTSTTVGSVVSNLYRMHGKAGNGRLDYSSILNLITGLQS